MGNGLFGIGKKEKAGKKPDGMVFSMIRLVAEGGENVLSELLQMCEPYFGVSTLSIVRSEDRKVFATSSGSDEYDEIEHVARKVKNVDKRYHYLKNEMNGLFFREGIGCIRVYPLKVVSGKPCFLMVEQRVSKNADVSKVLEVLAIAVRIYSMDREFADFKEMDSESGLKSRDALIKMLNEAKEDDYENYLAMYHIPYMTDIVLKEGKGKGDTLVRKTASILREYFPDVYRVGEAKFCVWSKGKKFEIVAKLQDALDELMEKNPLVEYGCIMCPGTEIVYKALYQCEKVSETRWGDMVVVLKDIDSDFEHAETYDSNPYMRKCEKPESDVSEDTFEKGTEEGTEAAEEKKAEEEVVEESSEEDSDAGGNGYVDMGFASFASSFEEDFGWDS